jgi:hypothetical protein
MTGDGEASKGLALESRESGVVEVSSSSGECCGLHAGGEIVGVEVKSLPELEGRHDGLQYCRLPNVRAKVL